MRLVIDISLVNLTGFLSIISQFFAVVLSVFCIVDFLSYRTRKVLLITLSYLFFLAIALLAFAQSLLQTYGGGMLWNVEFSVSYNSILISCLLHLFFGVIIIGIHLRNTISERIR